MNKVSLPWRSFKNIKDSTNDAFLRCPLVLNAGSHIQKSQEDIAMLRNRLRSLQDLWRNEQKSWTPKIRGFLTQM